MHRYWIIATVLALSFPAAALADLTGTVILQSPSFKFSFDTGATVKGGDIQFVGNAVASTIAPLGGSLFDAGPIGAASYNGLTQANVAAAAFSQNPILPDTLTVGEVFFVHTQGGNYAKALVAAISPGSITLAYTTFGVPGGPVVVDVQNNASLLPVGYVAPSTLIVIHGAGLANTGTAPATLWNVAQAPLPLTLNGASVNVTVNGTIVQPAIYYASAAQIDAVLPSATPIGSGTLTVTVGGTTSSPLNIQVVSSALGFDTYNGNWAVATDASTYALLTPTNPGSPGQIITFWGTGLGADPADSDTTYTTTPHSVDVPLQIYIGGVKADILYQGASGYPGLNQINVTIPLSVPTGCYVAVVGITGGVVSNSATLPIATNGGVCSDPAFGLTGAVISTLSGKTTLNTGQLNLSQLALPGSTGPGQTSADAILARVIGAGPAGLNLVSLGGCIVNETVTGNSNVSSSYGLRAGTLTFTGSAGNPIPLTTVTFDSSIYLPPLPPAPPVSIPSAGTFHATGATQLTTDLTGTVALNVGSALSLDTGATSPACTVNCAGAGGDFSVLYPPPFSNNTVLNIFAANASLYHAGIQTSPALYNNINAATAAALLGAFSVTRLFPEQLGAGEVFLVHTQGGNFAKVMITSMTSSSITVTYRTFATGGTQIGPFTFAASLPTPALNWTNQGAAVTVTRASGLDVSWTGGAASNFVTIVGSASASGLTGTFTCNMPASAGQFTVPSYILQGLPAGAGFISVQNSTNYTSFTATGLDIGLAFGVVTAGNLNSTYQ